MNKGYLYADITKAERDENGDLVVTGTAASSSLDTDKQIADPTWLKSAMPAWMAFGNVREQHSKIAAGIGMELTEDGDNKWQLKAAVIDPVTAMKVEKKVLKGFSIGIKAPRIDKSAAALKQAPGGIIVGGEIVEISLVDRGSNPDSNDVVIAKSAGGDWEPVDIDKAADDEVDCPTCDGKGKIRGGNVDCPDCDGSGKVTPAKAAELKKAVQVEITKSFTQALTDEAGPTATEITAAYALVDGELVKKDYSDDERSEMADKGQALPGGGFPIKNEQDLKNAVQAIGRAKDPAAAKAHIIKRAKALGQPDLIPESWKTADGELNKATDDEWTHDPAQVAECFASICNLLKAEIDEWVKGEDESCDVSELLCAAQMVANWAKSEANEGEIPQPFTQGDDDVSILSFGVDPDIVKAATAEDATDEAKDAYRAELLKALGIDDKIAAVIPDAVKGLLEERDAALEERIKRVEDAAAPGGPVTTRTQAEAAKATEADRLRAEAAHYRQIAGTVDHNTRTAYLEKATECDRQANALSTSTT